MKSTLLKVAAAATLALLMFHSSYGVSPHLLMAIKDGDVERVKTMLPGETDINGDINGLFALKLAVIAEKNNAELVRQVLAKGADVNQTDEVGRSPLHLAVARPDIEVVKLLIANGANLNVKDKKGFSPIFYAAGANNVEAAKLLLDKGADFSAPERPATWAAMMGSIEFMAFLLERGMDVNAAIPSGRTALHFAAVGNEAGMIKFLLSKGADPNRKDKDGATPLQLAKKENSAAAILALGGEIDETITDKNGNTALHFAAEMNRGADVKKFIDKGVKVNAKNKQGWTPLHVAAKHNSADAAKVLLANGARQLKTEDGKNPLHIAALHNSIAVIKLLLENGAKVNVKEKGGITPLDLACASNHVDAAKLLLGKGAKVSYDLVKYVIEEKLLDMAKVLIASKQATVNISGEQIQVKLFTGAKYSDFLLALAVNTNDVELVRTLLAELDDINFIMVGGAALCIAAEHGNAEMCRVLLAEVSKRVKTVKPEDAAREIASAPQKTFPLHCAVTNGHVECAKLMLDGGIDVNTRDEGGNTPLHLAVQSKNPVVMTKFLMSRGAKANMINGLRKKPIELTKNEEIIELLDGED